MSKDNIIPSYAPTSTGYYLPSEADVSKYYKRIERSQLIKGPNDRIVYDSISEIVSILTALQMIENAFLKDFITDKEKYTPVVLRLISQCGVISKDFLEDETKQKILFRVLEEVFPIEEKLYEKVAAKFNLQVSQALKRLSIGVPQTMEKVGSHIESVGHQNDSTVETQQSTSTGARLIAEVTGNFITCMDALKLNYRTREKLHPLLSDLVVSLNDLVTSSENGQQGKTVEFQGKSRLVNWLIKLNNLGDVELNQEESDSFLNDLDFAYKNFYTSLN